MWLSVKASGIGQKLGIGENEHLQLGCMLNTQGLQNIEDYLFRNSVFKCILEYMIFKFPFIIFEICHSKLNLLSVDDEMGR